MIGTTPPVWGSDRVEPGSIADLRGTIDAGRVWNGTLINQRKDGSEYPEEITITPVLDEVGKILRFIAIKRDVSEKIAMEREREIATQLEAKHRELEKVNEARRQFLSNVSHELRTPLTSVLAFSDVLGRNKGNNLTERELSQIDVIKRGGRRLNACWTSAKRDGFGNREIRLI